MYKPVNAKVHFPDMEMNILDFWQTHNIFHKSIKQRENADRFIFYDGPPFATGLPHFGHFVPGTVKDVIPRYQTMKGYRVDRRFGWDCHGLPVEYEMEKELGISGAYAIEKYGVAKFNEACRSIVLRYTAEWREIVTRMGRWVDFDNEYKTMDTEYMESIWWVFKMLWEKDLIYQGYYILPYSPALATPLSNFEVNLGGYHMVDDPAITVKFALGNNVFALAWTTTPWTLPSNLGLAVGKDIQYVKVKDGDEYYIVAKDRLEYYYRNADEYTVVEYLKGSDLAGKTYTPLFSYCANLADSGGFQIHTGDFVTTHEGTGIVHIAPGFGEDDYNLLKSSGLPIFVPIDAEARFTDAVPDFQGKFVKDADKEIIAWLKQKGMLVRKEMYRHSYPFCYRSKKPLIYRAVRSWFVNVTKIKQAMLEANAQIQWIPGHLQNGRFGNWLADARDWAISRNRYWGNPIPVWKCEGSDHMEVIASLEELEKKSGVKVKDLHKHYVDNITWDSPDGKGKMCRVPEVLDCWFESGAMPYAQNHYPFENQDTFRDIFPADFICEGLDQTRGWFYTLTVLGAALFGSPAFKNVIVNGLVLAADGKKMSKSEKNYSDPKAVISYFGADTLRLFLMNSGVVRADDLKYSDDGVRDILKTVLIPYWNAYSFFITYANIDKLYVREAPDDPTHPLDRWILSEIEKLIETITQNLDSYNIEAAVKPMIMFIDSLNNWYIRRSRRRFWKSENDAGKKQAYGTLYTVLLKFTMAAAPFVPFITEEIYQNLRGKEDPESVHLCDYPTVKEKYRDVALESKMAITRQTVRLGRAIRTMHAIKIRQPLAAIHLVTRDEETKRIIREMENIVQEELNVKSVVFRENEEELVHYTAKANFRVLGSRLGKDMRAAAEVIASLAVNEVQQLLDGATLSIEVSGVPIDITKECIVVQRHERDGMKVLSDESLTVALDTNITASLYKEGIVRDFIRIVQTMRKEQGLFVTDRIILFIAGDKELISSVKEHEDHFLEEVLAQRINWEIPDNKVQVNVGKYIGYIALQKV